MDWEFLLILLLVAAVVVYLIIRLDLKALIEQLRRELGE
jgi:uncharacterized membrane-anchored protein YhcB (DUF1043 family)